ncbi:MAG TPA: hypothetical protein VHJ82_00275 [Actinomycetota bacterium]|nr:hypothetical protein [Actinomycetota bacterium]
MIRSVLTVVAGAVAALESERLTQRFKDRFRAATLTDALLGKLNRHLEESRGASDPAAPSPEAPA